MTHILFSAKEKKNFNFAKKALVGIYSSCVIISQTTVGNRFHENHGF
jgi:hypothetical protein